MFYLHSSERLAIEPCRREQVRALADRLQNSNGFWTAEIPESINRRADTMVLPRVLRTPHRPWSDATWRALLTSDAAIHMDRQRFTYISAIFASAQMLRDRQVAAFDLSGEISHLSMSGPLDATQRRDVYAALNRLASMEGIMTVHARQVHQALTQIHFENEQRFIRFTSGDVDLADFIASDVEIYGACVDITQFQPFIDDLNATTGMNFTLASLETAP